MSERISDDQIRHVAHLARLKLTDEEVAQFGAQLGGIIEYVRQLSEVNTDGVEPTAHALPVCNVFRADEPAPSLDSAQALANAPASDTPFFKVPKVLDQDSA